MVIVFALLAAVLYGSGDFLGGAAAKGAHVLSVVLMSGAAGAVVVGIAAMVSGEPVRSAGIGWGVAAGAVGAVGLVIFYAGLAAGPMSVVSPISALVATVLPVGVALAEGERPGATVYAGAAFCLVAIVLVSSGSGGESLGAGPGASGSRQPAPAVPVSQVGGRLVPGRAVAFGIGSGASFGLFFLFLRSAGQSGELWPVLWARLSGMAIVMIAALVLLRRPVPRSGARGVVLAAVGAGVCDACANISYIIATRVGLFGLAVVLTSLYPGATVLLARFVLGERLGRPQQIGLAVAAVGIALVTA